MSHAQAERNRARWWRDGWGKAYRKADALDRLTNRICERLFRADMRATSSTAPGQARASLAEGESDPTGRRAGDAGAKLDAGKNRLGLVLGGFARALQEVGRVGTYGAGKYSENGWMQVPNGEARYTDAMLRHLMQELAGEACDGDTGIPHAAHAAWNALARLDLMLRKNAEAQKG
jgi:hypothetical protein